LRLLSEFFVPARRQSGDESLADFAVRRFGREAFERLIQPLVGGIYTADPYRLSMNATMARFAAMEHQYGSLIRSAFAARQPATSSLEKHHDAGARYGLFVAPQLGMQQLVDAIAARLPPRSVRLGCRVQSMTRQGDEAWHLQVSQRDGHVQQLDAQAVILAVPAPQAAKLLVTTHPALAQEIEAIPHASTAVAILGCSRQSVAHRLNGFGFVVPLVERRRILAASFSSIKFPRRAPDNHLLLRVFIGGACQPEALQHSNDELLAIAKQELRELIGLQGDCDLELLVRWTNAMPQYHVGHVQRVEKIEQYANDLPRFALAGNAYRGVGIPYCIRSGEDAARRVIEACRL
jgi:oxygen-dependent protoporphyrinogen oxidase